MPPPKVVVATRCEKLIPLDWLEYESIIPYSLQSTSIVILKPAQEV